MSKTPWTPGPWKAVCRDISYSGGEWSEHHFLQWEVEGPKPVGWGRGEFYQADARLIAAAPEMAEVIALLLATRTLAPLDPARVLVVDEARALLARIRGDAT